MVEINGHIKPGLLLLWVLILFFSCTIEASELTVRLDKTEVERGKYILAEITYQGDNAAGEFNLVEWQSSFYIDRRDSDTLPLENGWQQKTIHVRLYPRVSGQVILASIAFGGAIAKSTEVTVKPSLRNGIDGTPVIKPVLDYYWTDQAIIIQLDIALHDPRNIVESGEFEEQGFSITTLKAQKIDSAAGIMIRLQWLMLTPQKGHYDIELPVIHQRGRGRFSYYLPRLKLNIKPLPAYLPATIAVGQITLHSEMIQAENSLTQLQLTLTKTGRLPAQIEGIQTLLDSFGVDHQHVVIENRYDRSSAKQSRIYRIPLPAWYFAYPDRIHLPYFDTLQGKLKYQRHTFPEYWQIPHYVKIIAIFILILVMIYAGYQINRLVIKIRQWKRLHNNISQSTSTHQLRKLLLQTQPAKHLTEWAAFYNNSISQQIAANLNALCFQGDALIDFDRVKNLCLQLYTFKLFVIRGK